MNQTLDYFIADPAGNTTILVVSPVNRTDYQKIAQLLLEHHPEAEQVGYIVSPQTCLEPAPDVGDYNEEQKKAQEAAAAAAKAGLPRMEMCGLEFCGNASRAFGYYAALQQDPPLEEIEICVSGCDYPLHVGVTEAGTLKEGHFTFSLRERYVYDYKVAASKGENILRSKASISYNIPHTKISPYVAEEMFTWKHWMKTRHYIGTKLSLDKHSTLDFFYMYYTKQDKKFQQHLLGLGYILKI